MAETSSASEASPSGKPSVSSEPLLAVQYSRDKTNAYVRKLLSVARLIVISGIFAHFEG